MRKLNFFITILIFISILPLNVLGTAVNSPELNVSSAVLINAETGQVLFDKNMNTIMFPASITKIMTGMLALQDANLSDVLTTSFESVHGLPKGTSHIALDTDEQITLEQALYALAIESANDAANVIAENLAGSTQDFAANMTAYAHELGAINTNFVNAHGLHEETHVTTAYDMALIARAALKTEGFNKIFSTHRYQIPPTNVQPETRMFNNANFFISNQIVYDELLMSKNGWTPDAKHTLVTAVKKNDITLIAVVMNTDKRDNVYDDTVALFDYGFDTFSKVSIDETTLINNLPDTFTLQDGSSIDAESLKFIAEDLSVLLPNGANPLDITVTHDMPYLKENSKLLSLPLTFHYNIGDKPSILNTTTATITVAEPVLAPVEITFYESFINVVVILLKIIVSLVILFFVIVLSSRTYFYTRYRIRKKRRYRNRLKQQLINNNRIISNQKNL